MGNERHEMIAADSRLRRYWLGRVLRRDDTGMTDTNFICRDGPDEPDEKESIGVVLAGAGYDFVTIASYGAWVGRVAYCPTNLQAPDVLRILRHLLQRPWSSGPGAFCCFKEHAAGRTVY
jgi:hypothetical protein